MDSPSSEPLRFFVPQSVLDAAHDWQQMHGVLLTLPLPADTEPWQGLLHSEPEIFNITTLQENP